MIFVAAQSRLNDLINFECVVVGIFHRSQRRGMAFGFIAIQEDVACVATNDSR